MSTIKQLSIFLENRAGRLYEVMEILANANVGIIAAFLFLSKFYEEET